MKSIQSVVAIGFIPIVLALTSFGCATKSYVKKQIAPVDQKTAVNATAIAQLGAKQEADVSRLDEKILSVDNKATQAMAAAGVANASATEANQLARKNQADMAANQAAIDAKLAAENSEMTNFEKSMTYSLVAKGDVTFDFNKAVLRKVDEAALDTLIQGVDSLLQHSQSATNVRFELMGFTDNVGGAEYNFALSRRRSEAVARYLLNHGVPLQGIHTIGMGKEPVPPSLLADIQAVDHNATDANSRRLARRVLIRIYTSNGTVQSAALQ
jgi:OOP family OmpA-OmpF porin